MLPSRRGAEDHGPGSLPRLIVLSDWVDQNSLWDAPFGLCQRLCRGTEVIAGPSFAADGYYTLIPRPAPSLSDASRQHQSSTSRVPRNPACAGSFDAMRVRWRAWAPVQQNARALLPPAG